MKGFSKISTILLIAIAVIGGGYFAVNYFGGIGESKKGGLGEGELEIYRNNRYGFEFKYLSDFQLYERLDYEKRELIMVSPVSATIHLSKKFPQEFYSGGADLKDSDEVVIFSEQTKSSASEWLISNYPDEFKEVRPLEMDFDGRNAAILPGAGNVGSSARVSVIEMDGYLLIIDQYTENDTAGFIINTFKFVK